jgi:hypothetical protein
VSDYGVRPRIRLRLALVAACAPNMAESERDSEMQISVCGEA